MSESYYLMPLMMGTVCHYYYGSSGPNHWVSFIPLCNMGQFVTMSNEKIPVSRPKYLQIIRCLTLYWLLWTISQKWTAPDAGAAFWHSHIPNKTKIFYMKGENTNFLDFTLNAGLKKIMKVNWTRLLRPALISHCEWWGLILKCRGFLRVLNNKQSVIIRYQVTWTIHPNHQAHTLGECCQGKSVWKEADLDWL